jgi:hypothetical protein
VERGEGDPIALDLKASQQLDTKPSHRHVQFYLLWSIMQTMKEKIESWLVEEGQFNRYVEHPNANWVLLANHPKNQPTTVSIINPKASPDRILVEVSVTIADDVQQLFQKLTQPQRERILRELSLELNRFPISFGMIHPQGILRQLVLQQEIFSDGLTKHALFTAIQNVYKAFLQSQWLLQKELGGQLKPGNDFGIGFRPSES